MFFRRSFFRKSITEKRSLRTRHSLPFTTSVQDNLRRCYSMALAPEATPRPNELTSLPMPLMVLQPVMKVTTIAMSEIDKMSFFIGTISGKERAFV